MCSGLLESLVAYSPSRLLCFSLHSTATAARNLFVNLLYECLLATLVVGVLFMRGRAVLYKQCSIRASHYTPHINSMPTSMVAIAHSYVELPFDPYSPSRLLCFSLPSTATAARSIFVNLLYKCLLAALVVGASLCGCNMCYYLLYPFYSFSCYCLS